MAVALLAACASVPQRATYDETQQAVATIDGFDDIRFYADDDGSAFRNRMIERVLAEVAAKGPDVLKRGSAEWLMISGGGEDGAFGAGLLVGLTDAGQRPQYELVSGVSTGALMAPFAFLGPHYDEQLRRIFTDIGKESVFKFAGLPSLVGGAAAMDTTPLRRTIDAQLTDRMLDEIAAAHRNGRRLYIVTTNLDAQRPVVWDMGKIAATPSPRRRALFLDVLLASASIPGLFPPVFIKAEANGVTIEEMHVDGGTTMQVLTLPTTISPGTARRPSVDRRKRTLYMLMNNSMQPRFDATRSRTFAIAGRSLSTIIKAHGVQSIQIMYDLARKHGAAFNVAYIESDFTKKLPAPFDEAYMEALFDYGYRRALEGRAWRDAPPGTH
ncbi:patatin-like phospholipase family protein [Polymorphum gilvum]|uniref:Patatin-like phospholipase domain n=1 Tax=Polymorphum gilvum (strain LMG 25793 / CGMCC 1.9160 / SL003B-26A1) TaxID=991905 RepID=F2IY46_POLGS|nr:patatin-like phospholipase family protein [Polymorphum gilvum]ADZ70550.1 Patatin-like phospholipase domain [Polymorphum gilvum SL003B-26A1]